MFPTPKIHFEGATIEGGTINFAWILLKSTHVLKFESEFEWRFYALSASKAIFRTITYSRITYSLG